MTDEVKAYMKQHGFEWLPRKSHFPSNFLGYWVKQVDGEPEWSLTAAEATFFYDATRKAKVEVLEAVKTKVIGHDDEDFNEGDSEFQDGANALRRNQRQVTDQLIKENTQ